jgi:preprotein translocase subunit SecB
MTNEATSAPAQPTSIQMQVLSQYVKDISFESPNVPGVLALLQQTQPQVNVSVTVGFRPLGTPPNAQAPLTMESILTIKAEGKVQETKGFIVECTYCGIFALPQNLPENIVRGVMMVEAPRLLFPFARQIASECVMNGGFGPLLIAPVDFLALHMQQTQTEQLATQKEAGHA